MTEPTIPIADLAHVAEAQARFDSLIAGLDEETARRPSRLPAWTIGHVLTHIARNADSHRRRAEAAVAGVVVEQYPGGPATREAEIEGGAGRSAAALVADVRDSAIALAHAWRDVPPESWSATSVDVTGKDRTLASLPMRRWTELEIHAMDLGLGLTHHDLPEHFVTYFRPRLRKTVADRLLPGVARPSDEQLDALVGRDEVAWLFGRIEIDDLPVLTMW